MGLVTVFLTRLKGRIKKQKTFPTTNTRKTLRVLYSILCGRAINVYTSWWPHFVCRTRLIFIKNLFIYIGLTIRLVTKYFQDFKLSVKTSPRIIPKN